jgi:hypothetical protein
MCAKMPTVIESVGDQGQRVERGFEWPDDSALKRVEKEGGRQTRILGALFKSKLRARPTPSLDGSALTPAQDPNARGDCNP